MRVETVLSTSERHRGDEATRPTLAVDRRGLAGTGIVNAVLLSLLCWGVIAGLIALFH